MPPPFVEHGWKSFIYHCAMATGLAILPLILVAAFYYRPVLEKGLSQLPVDGDANFYVYQLYRAGELNGRWWKLGEDESLGSPYQTVFANHPGIYEGLDLILLSSVTSKFFDPVVNYHALMVVVLILNGWAASLLVYRLTGSYFWAAVSVALITVNPSIALRLNGHAHLFKLFWELAAVWSFHRFLQLPTLGRGAILGLVMALLLQGSFYFGYLLALVLATWWLGCLLAGRLDRRHWVALVPCAAVFTVFGAAFTYPVWGICKDSLLADHYFRRGTCPSYNSELWQYVTPPYADRADRYMAVMKAPEGVAEGWHYPGTLALAATALYLLFRLRGCRFGTYQSFLDLLMGLIALCVFFSLSGGMATILNDQIRGFRCFGREGLLALGLWCVATPLILHGLVGGIGKPWLRGTAAVCLLIPVAYDLWNKPKSKIDFVCKPAPAPPAWVEWLSRQPEDARLVVFAPPRDMKDVCARSWHEMYHRLLHKRAVLNGCEFFLLESDLKLLGARFDELNRDGLRFLMSLDYNRFVFHQEYLDANPWIASHPDLIRTDAFDRWIAFRVSTHATLYPRSTVADILAETGDSTAVAQAPAGKWITETIDGLKEKVVVLGGKSIYLAWEDGKGRYVGKPTYSLFQHVFGPGIPAYCIKTPSRGGRYQLVFLDESRRRITAKSYEITTSLRSIEKANFTAPFTVNTEFLSVGKSPQSSVRVTLHNTTSYYLQSNTFRFGSGAPHPGFEDAKTGSLLIRTRIRGATVESPIGYHCLPHDLPPGATVEMEIPLHRFAKQSEGTQLEITPIFQLVPVNEVSPERTEIRLGIIKHRDGEKVTKR